MSTAEICLELPGREHAWWVWADRGVFDESGTLVGHFLANFRRYLAGEPLLDRIM